MPTSDPAKLMEQLRREIAEKTYATVPFGLSFDQIQSAVDDFMGFLTLPQEVKERFFFRLISEDRGTEVGYRKRRKELGDLDEKEYFHYNEYAAETFGPLAESVPELKTFLAGADMIYQEAKTQISAIISAFDLEFPGLYQKFFPTDRFPRLFLRFLSYNKVEPGEFLAKGHYDRGACTLAIAESAPGLRMGLDDRQLTPVVHKEHNALFMPGLKFSRLTSEEFPSVWHDVVQKGSDSFNPDVARWAVVFFADQFDMENVTFDEAHTAKY